MAPSLDIDLEKRIKKIEQQHQLMQRFVAQISNNDGKLSVDKQAIVDVSKQLGILVGASLEAAKKLKNDEAVKKLETKIGVYAKTLDRLRPAQYNRRIEDENLQMLWQRYWMLQQIEFHIERREKSKELFKQLAENFSAHFESMLNMPDKSSAKFKKELGELELRLMAYQSAVLPAQTTQNQALPQQSYAKVAQSISTKALNQVKDVLNAVNWNLYSTGYEALKKIPQLSEQILHCATKAAGIGFDMFKKITGGLYAQGQEMVEDASAVVKSVSGAAGRFSDAVENGLNDAVDIFEEVCTTVGDSFEEIGNFVGDAGLSVDSMIAKGSNFVKGVFANSPITHFRDKTQTSIELSDFAPSAPDISLMNKK